MSRFVRSRLIGPAHKSYLEEAVRLRELGGLRDVGDVGLRERVGERRHAVDGRACTYVGVWESGSRR